MKKDDSLANQFSDLWIAPNGSFGKTVLFQFPKNHNETTFFAGASTKKSKSRRSQIR